MVCFKALALIFVFTASLRNARTDVTLSPAGIQLNIHGEIVPLSVALTQSFVNHDPLSIISEYTAPLFSQYSTTAPLFLERYPLHFRTLIVSPEFASIMEPSPIAVKPGPHPAEFQLKGKTALMEAIEDVLCGSVCFYSTVNGNTAI